MCEIPARPCLGVNHLEIKASLCKEPLQSNGQEELDSRILIL